MLQRAIRTGSSIVEIGFLYDIELKYATDVGTQWYRSKDKKAGENPFISHMLNKKWTLEEEFNNHMLRFQQVTVSFDYFNKLHFKIPDWIDSLRSSFQSGKGRR